MANWLTMHGCHVLDAYLWFERYKERKICLKPCHHGSLQGWQRQSQALQAWVFPIFLEKYRLKKSQKIEKKKKKGLDSHEVDDDTLMALSHQKYKNVNYKHALDHNSEVYERNRCRTSNLLLLGSIHYQFLNYDQCIMKNEEAFRINPHFAKCYGNIANA